MSISRTAGTMTLPGEFMLVAAMNPCPCGYLGDRKRESRCGPVQIQRYRDRIRGPLLDRIDMHVEVPAVGYRELRSTHPGREPRRAIRARVEAARGRVQRARFRGTAVQAATPG